MSEPTIVEALESSSAPAAKLLTQAQKLLTDAGLKMPAVKGKLSADQLLNLVKANVPAAHWVTVGEKAGKQVESRDAVGKWTTRVSCHYDRSRHIVVEHHIRGDLNDLDQVDAWADVKKFKDAAKADVQWARYGKKYRFESGVAPKPVVVKAAAPKGANDAALFEAWAKKPSDENALRVLADAWAENGDPRGEFVQLSLLKNPNADQKAKRDAIAKKAGGALVGPARPFLREWQFGSNGVVEIARTEADKLPEGIGAISTLNPSLCLAVTSLKKLATAEALATISLAPIHYVSFAPGLIGSLDGSNIPDKALRAAAPAFRGVKNLSLMVRGYVGDCFLPDAFRVLADQLEGIEYLALHFYTGEAPGKVALPPVGAYVDVITSHPNFKSLQAVIVDGANAAQLKKLPKVKHVGTNTDKLPSTAEGIATLKKG